MKHRNKMWMMLLVGLMALISPDAAGHQPTISDGTFLTPESALYLDDIQLSRVVYQDMTEAAPVLWIEFEVDRPQDLFVSLGVPLIDRLAEFRPAFAVIGPGLPPLDAPELPFSVPSGLGGIVFGTDEVVDPEVFDEPFTGTRSWILREESVSLPDAGNYFLVAFAPTGETGKLWLAPGRREEFSLNDFVELGGVVGDIRAFHEESGTGLPCFMLPVAALLPFGAALWFVGTRRKRGETENSP